MSTPLTTAQWVRFSIIGIILIIVIFLLYQIFHKSKPVDESYKAEIAVRDSLLAEKDKNIKLLMQMNQQRDESIKAHEVQDSLLWIMYKANQIKYHPINIKYESIPVTVGGYTKSQLRSEITNY